jgi:SAM-dependent methyltransferase
MSILKKYYKEKKVISIVDFGCGDCQVIKLLKDEGYDVLGLDATPYSNASFVQKRDLSKMIRLPKTYDFVQSFEVGEHIYTEFEDVFISNLVWNAERGLILSWAVEGQNGFHHINTHNNDYIIAKIEGYGFKYNKELSSEFKAQFDNWFKNSLMVFDRV